MIQQTSIFAFNRNKKQKQTIKERVLNCLTGVYGKTAYEVSNTLKLRITSIRPRLTDLYKEGKVMEAGTRYDPVAQQNCIIYKKKVEV